MPKSLKDIADAMRKIDFTMLTTMAKDGGLASRPMSNNNDVEYDGDSWFFTSDTTDMVAEIAANPRIGLTLHGNSGIFGKPPLFIAAAAYAELIRNKAIFAAHWKPELDRWFAQGVDTPGLVLIKAHADHLHYWDGEEHGEIHI